jgi:hypothetical protein
MPPFGVPSWPGVTCDAQSGSDTTRAFFEVPGVEDPKGKTGDFFRLPFPNDARRSGGGLDLEGFPTPGDELLGFDPVQLYLDELANESAWGTYPTVIFRFSAPIDFETFRAEDLGPEGPSPEDKNPVVWVDITPGEPDFASAGLYWYASEGGGKYVCPNWFGVRRPQGSPLVPGHVYAVYLTTDGRDSDGNEIERSPHLVAALSDSAPSDAKLAEVHAAYAPFRAYLGAEGIDSSEILNATVITAGNVRDTMAALAAAVEAAPVPTASSWVKCGGGASSPCPQAEDDRACPASADAAFDEYHALVSLPIFQQGDAPYVADGGGITTSGPVRNEDVCMALTVPKGASMPANGWPLVVYAHGTGGSFRSHAGEVAASLAVAGAPSGSVPMAVLGIDQVQHGPRRGSSDESPNNLFYNFANPHAARGNPLQGAADQLALARFAASLNATAAETGGDPIRIDPAGIVFYGHSQGSTHGSLMLPYASEYKAAVLSGNGASLMHALLNKTSPVNIAAAVPFVLGDFDVEGNLSGGDMHPVLGALQHWIDPADPLNYARAAGREPLDGETAKHLFQTYGLKDTFSPGITMETYALAARLAVATDDPSVAEHEPAPSACTAEDECELIGKHEMQALPVVGNETVGGNPVTLGVRRYGPPGSKDGHFVATDVASASGDVARFLAMAAIGTVPQIGQ